MEILHKRLKNHRKKEKKRLVQKRKGKFSKTGIILSENWRLQIFAKNGRFPTKMGGLESLAFRGGWHCACYPRPRQLELTYSRLLFGWLMMIMMIINGYVLNLEIVLVLENVCWHRPGSHSMWVTASWPGVFLLGASWRWGRFFTQLLFHNPYSGKIFWC